MRTTVTLDDDVAAAVESLRVERGVGISSVINQLVRSGLAHRAEESPEFVQATSSGGARMDLTDVAGVLDLLDGPAVRSSSTRASCSTPRTSRARTTRERNGG